MNKLGKVVDVLCSPKAMAVTCAALSAVSAVNVVRTLKQKRYWLAAISVLACVSQAFSAKDFWTKKDSV